MKLTLAKNLDALRTDGLLRLDRGMRGRRAVVGGVNADIHAAKIVEARAVVYSKDSAPSAPLLAAEAKVRSMAIRDLAIEVIAKQEATADEIAMLEAIRQATQAAIRSATTQAAIEAAITKALGDI